MKETELKFQVPAAAMARLLKAVATASAQTTRLQAVYADTADRRLAANQMALRLRKEGRVWVQTLKGRGDGLMQRLEHEVVLPPQRGTPVLDVQRHAGTPMGERLMAVLDGEPLVELYRTDIQRVHRIVRSRDARIEVALDRGWLVAGEGAARRRLAVNEIEFELKDGPVPLLLGLALKWAARHGLWWDCRTKSERGLRLALGVPTVPATPAASARPVRSLRAWQAAVGAAVAHALPNAAEIADGLASADHERELLAAAQRLARLLPSPAAGELAPVAEVLHAALLRTPVRADADAVRGLSFNALMLGALSLSLPLEAA